MTNRVFSRQNHYPFPQVSEALAALMLVALVSSCDDIDSQCALPDCPGQSVSGEFRSSSDKIKIVDGSPQAVATHDKQGWLNLFTPDAEILDPVGAGGFSTSDKREAFYETFIAPHKIRFEVHQDIVCGNDVWRDVTIHTSMSEGSKLAVPALLNYEIRDFPQNPKIAKMHAYWQLPDMTKSLLDQPHGLSDSNRQSERLLHNFGFLGALDYSRGFDRAGKLGIKAAQRRLEDEHKLTVTKILNAGWKVAAAVVDENGRAGVAVVEISRFFWLPISTTKCWND